jgi:tight adherence protein C
MWQWFKLKLSIFSRLPDALGMMVVCVEAGLGLDQSLQKFGEELGKSHPNAAEQFKIAKHPLQLRRPRSQVLQAMGSLSGIDELRMALFRVREPSSDSATNNKRR